MYKLRNIFYAFFLMLGDLSALLASFLLAYWLRSRILPSIHAGFKELVPLPLGIQLRYGFLYVAIFSILVISYEKLYTKRLSLWDETKHLLIGVTLSFTFLMMTIYVAKAFTRFSRVVIILAWLLSLILFPVFRLASRKLLFLAKLFRKKVFILGTNELAVLVAKEIERNWTLGYEIAGFLSMEKDKVGGKFIGDIPVVGTIDQVELLSKEHGVRDFIVTLPGLSEERLLEIVENCEKAANNIRIVPDIGHLFSKGVEIENWGDILALSMARNLVKPSNLFIKEVFEFILALVLFVLLLPVFLLIAAAIKIDSRGPVLYSQERLGRKDKTFKFLKFRSMYIDGDARLEKYLADNAEAKEDWKRFLKIRKNDPRVTRVGRFIRKYSLDELPQLINVLRGEMSLVGPRPYMPRERNEIGKSFPIISRVKPGITGLWQVRGRNILTFKERLALDEYYIRNWSLWMDIVIFLRTLKVMVTGEGAY
jgi:undecaprenyl-phosphate galactose phosphotransferase